MGDYASYVSKPNAVLVEFTTPDHPEPRVGEFVFGCPNYTLVDYQGEEILIPRRASDAKPRKGYSCAFVAVS